MTVQGSVPGTFLIRFYDQQTRDLTDAQRLDGLDILMIVRYVFLAISLPVTLCNVIVFLQKSMHGATSVYILGLSFAQIVFLSAHVGLSLWSGLVVETRSSSSFCLFQVFAITFGSMIARRGSYVILCFVSMERLYAILRPLHVKQCVLSRCSVAVMLATYVVTTALHLYVPARLTVVMAPDDAVHTPLCQSRVTELYLRHKVVNDSFSLAIKILMTYMALILQIVLNLLTIFALRRHNRASEHVKPLAKEEARSQREHQLTVTILCTTIAYVVLSLPSCLNGLLNIVVPEYNDKGQYKNLAIVIYNVCLDLQILSCSVDFFCFFALSSNYRRTFFRSFPCLRPASLKKAELDCQSTFHASVTSSETKSWGPTSSHQGITKGT
ncbi:hypothetical protein ACOMHN_032889 [Nucella lapillus]